MSEDKENVCNYCVWQGKMKCDPVRTPACFEGKELPSPADRGEGFEEAWKLFEENNRHKHLVPAQKFSFEAGFNAALARREGKWISVKDKLPKTGKIVWCALQHWYTKNYRYAELKKVNEDDCEWRTADDNSEIANEWNVTHWQPLPEPLKQ